MGGDGGVCAKGRRADGGSKKAPDSGPKNDRSSGLGNNFPLKTAFGGRGENGEREKRKTVIGTVNLY